MSGQRHDAVVVDAWDGSSALTWKQVLQFEPDGPADWRVIELYSRRGTPFEARLQWSTGRGAGPEARLSVPTSTRVAVHCRSLAIFIANLAGSAATVGATVSDGSVNRWDNFFETRHAAAASAIAVPVPNYASRVRLECADHDLLATSFIETFDAGGTGRSKTRADRQPSSGVPLGGAAAVKVTCNTDHRLIWTLQL